MPLRILVLSSTFPRPDLQSGDRRLVAVLTHLAERHRIDYVVPRRLNDEAHAKGIEALRIGGVNVLGSGWAPLATALTRSHYHVAIFEFYRAFEDDAGIVRERQPGAVLLIDSVDVHFAREMAGAKLKLIDERTATATRLRELAAYRAADGVITVTENDTDILRREGGMPPLYVIPNAVPLRARADRPRGPHVLFVGGFRHPPNLDGVRWFVSEVWPRVRDAVPDATFSVAGSNPPPELAALGTVPGVRVLGYVPETAPAIDHASVSVAPLRYGGGMKGKVNEALAAGVPVVSTTVGVEGIPAIHGVHALVADHASEFADAVIVLLRNPGRARAMGLAGQELASNYSPERVGQLLDSMLRDVVPHPRALRPRLQWLACSGRVALRAVAREGRRAIQMRRPHPPKRGA